jgi:hypothetical protein
LYLFSSIDLSVAARREVKWIHPTNHSWTITQNTRADRTTTETRPKVKRRSTTTFGVTCAATTKSVDQDFSRLYTRSDPLLNLLCVPYKQQQQEQQPKFLNFDPRFQCWHYILDTLTHFKWKKQLWNSLSTVPTFSAPSTSQSFPSM